MRRPAGAAHRAQEARIDAFQHQRPPDQREDDQRHAGDADDQQQRRIVHRQHRAEQEVQQIDVGALDRDDGDAERERNEEERRERGVLLELASSARSGRRRRATTKPAIRPPPAMANRLRPATRKPMAAPGRMACAMASPIRLMRRSIRNTPIGAGAERQRKGADQRAAHELEVGERSDEDVVEHRRLRRHHAGFRLLVERLAHPPRLQHVLRRQHVGGRAPGHRLAREQQRLGEIRLAPFRGRASRPARCAAPHASAAPAPADRREVLASIALNGSSSTITRASCSSRRANSMRCICPPDSVPIGRGSKPVRPTAAIALSDGVAILAADAAEQAFAAPQPHRHHVVDADREAAVDLGDLRQIGDVLRPHAVALDPAGERLDARRPRP